MKKLIARTMLVVMALTFGGCNDDSLKPYRYNPTQETAGAGTSQTQTSQNNGSQQASRGTVVTFDLPAGWIRDEDKAPNRGIQWSPSSDGVKPNVLVEIWGSHGTKDEARQQAQDDHNNRMKYCSNAECAKWITYSEKNIAGIDVFISTDVNTYWGADSLSSILWFEKSGELYYMSFDDPVDAHLNQVKKIIETVHVVSP